MAPLMPVLTAAAPSAVADTGSDALDQALDQAQARKAAVLIDFHAPWCYSCYFMARDVLNGAEWDAVRKRAVVIEQDVDSPAGAALQQRWQIKALPSYLVLDAQGNELGRILGEQTRDDFYARLNALLDRGGDLETLARQAREGGPGAVASARAVLTAYLSRQDAQGGLGWYEGLPTAVRRQLDDDGDAQLLLARLRLLDDAQRKDRWACAVDGEAVLAGALGCERPYALQRYMGCIANGESDVRTLLGAQRPAMDALVERGAFGAGGCADQRSVVLAAADLYQALGDADAERKVLERAIEQTRARVDGRIGDNRNLDDNLRVFMARAGDRVGVDSRLDRLMLQLIEAYPDDYVYAYRYGRALVEQDQARKALPWLAQAATRAYGANRLTVAHWRAKALLALGQRKEAGAVVAEALKANGPWFPEQARELKALLSSASS